MTGSPRGGRATGYAEVVAAAALWGSSGIFSVFLFRRGMTPGSVALLRPALGLALLAAFFSAGRRRTLRVSAAALVPLIGIGGLLTGLFQLAYQSSIDSAGVPTTVALVYLAPALVVAASGPLLGEWPSRARVLLALLSVTGVWLTVLGARGAFVAASASTLGWGLLAGVAYAGYTLFGRYATPRFGSPATVVYSTAGACLVLALFLPGSEAGIDLPPDRAAWGLLLVFALLTIALATFLFYDGLGRIEADRAAIATTVEPVVAALLATALVGQGLTLTGWLGLGLVVGGVAGAYVAAGPTRTTGGTPH